MNERNGNSGNLLIAVVIAIIVGVVVFFLLDSRPVEAPTSTGIVTSGVTDTGSTMLPEESVISTGESTTTTGE